MVTMVIYPDGSDAWHFSSSPNFYPSVPFLHLPALLSFLSFLMPRFLGLMGRGDDMVVL